MEKLADVLVEVVFMPAAILASSEDFILSKPERFSHSKRSVHSILLTIFKKTTLPTPIIAISNHSNMLGGGEYSFLDLLSNISSTWNPIAVVPEEGELRIRLNKKAIKTEVIPLPALRPWFIHEVFSCFKAFFKACKKHLPELIYANGSRAAFYGNILGNLLNLPVIWHCRIVDRDPLLDLLLEHLSTRIIVNSQATANRFNHRCHYKVRVVYNGINTQWLADKDVRRPVLVKKDWKVILVVARVSKQKRHDLALYAFKHIARLNPYAHLFCIGAEDPLEPQWWSYLQEITYRSPFADRIHWIGPVDDIREWYHVANVLVLASENEAFGKVLVEAMACGVPVVVTKSGAFPEIVRNNQDGFLVNKGNTDELAKGVHKILNDDILRARLSNSARRHAENFGLEDHIKKIAQIFQDTIRQTKQ